MNLKLNKLSKLFLNLFITNKIRLTGMVMFHRFWTYVHRQTIALHFFEAMVSYILVFPNFVNEVFSCSLSLPLIPRQSYFFTH